MYKLLFVVAFALVTRDASADSTSFGKCPHIHPQEDFEMDKFLGVWYAIQKTSTEVPCIWYNVTQKEGHPGYYLLTESFPSSKLANFVGLRHDHYITGELCVHNKSAPAVMDLKIPYSIGSSKFTVFMSDYDNYAAIFSCKTYPLTFSRVHKWSAQILSRTPTLKLEFIEKIRSRLSVFNVNPFTLSTINQHHCEESGKKGVVLKTGTSFADKVEETIRDIAKDLMELKPKIEEAMNTAKTFIENEAGGVGEQKPKVDETVDTGKTVVENEARAVEEPETKIDPRVDTENVGEESGAGNKGFEQPEVFELFDPVEETKIEKGEHQAKPSYWKPDSDVKPTEMP